MSTSELIDARADWDCDCDMRDDCKLVEALCNGGIKQTT